MFAYQLIKKNVNIEIILTQLKEHDIILSAALHSFILDTKCLENKNEEDIPNLLVEICFLDTLMQQTGSENILNSVKKVVAIREERGLSFWLRNPLDFAITKLYEHHQMQNTHSSAMTMITHTFAKIGSFFSSSQAIVPAKIEKKAPLNSSKDFSFIMYVVRDAYFYQNEELAKLLQDYLAQFPPTHEQTPLEKVLWAFIKNYCWKIKLKTAREQLYALDKEIQDQFIPHLKPLQVMMENNKEASLIHQFLLNITMGCYHINTPFTEIISREIKKEPEKSEKLTAAFSSPLLTALHTFILAEKEIFSEFKHQISAIPLTECFDILGLSSQVELSEVKKKYYALSLQYHPDKNSSSNKKQDTERFIQLVEAYQKLVEYFETPVAERNNRHKQLEEKTKKTYDLFKGQAENTLKNLAKQLTHSLENELIQQFFSAWENMPGYPLPHMGMEKILDPLLEEIQHKNEYPALSLEIFFIRERIAKFSVRDTKIREIFKAEEKKLDEKFMLTYYAQ